MSRLSGKTIIITGATSGIGRSLAENLTNQGANLILISRSTEKLTKLLTDLNRIRSHNSQVYTADLTDRTACRSVFEKISQSNQVIDGLINNAGAGVFEYAHLTKPADVDRMFQLNVFSIIEALTIMIPFFTDQGFGHIINVASFAGKLSSSKSAVYSATKAAVIAYSNATRLELETKNVQLTTVNLGPVKTNFFKDADPDGHYQSSIAKFMLDPDTVADKITQNLFKRKREVNLPWWMAVGSKIHHQFPTLTEKMLSNQFKRK